MTTEAMYTIITSRLMDHLISVDSNFDRRTRVFRTRLIFMWIVLLLRYQLTRCGSIPYYSLKDSNSHHWELLQVVCSADGGQQVLWNWNGRCSSGPETVTPADGRKRPPASSSAILPPPAPPPSTDEYGGAVLKSENSSFMPVITPLRESSPTPASALALYLGAGSCSISASFSSCTIIRFFHYGGGADERLE
jgi:hypothetical protein